MAKSSGDESEHHVVGVRMRIAGVGNMQLNLTDYDDIRTYNMVPVPMQSATRIEPLRLANFQSQRIRLVGRTTEIHERFVISRILIYAKPVAAEYPA